MSPAERKVAWLASWSHFFTHGYMTLLPGVLVVVAGEQSLGFFALGAMVNMGYFLFGLGSIPAGILVDRMGAKNMLVLGLGGMAFSSILVGFSPNGWTFAVSYALLGLAASIYHPAGLSLIARHIDKKGKALSLHGILGNLGLSLAPLFAGMMVYFFDTWRAAYLSFGILGVFFAFIVQRSTVEGEESDAFRRLWTLIRQREWFSAEPAAPAAGVEEETRVMPLTLFCLYTGSILFGFIYRGSLTFFPALFQQDLSFVSASEQPVVLASIVTSAVLSVGIVGQWFGGYLFDRFPVPEKLHIFLYLLVIPALYGVARLTDSFLIAASIAFSLVFYGWQPIQNALIAKYTARRSYGKGYGVNFFFIMGMGSLATVVGGYIADDQGVDKVYLMLAITSVAGLLASMAVMKFRNYAIRYRFSVGKE